MKSIFNIVMIAGILLCGCSTSVSKEGEKDKANASEKVSTTNQVVETIMSRRSIRKYKPQPVEREKMEQIINCGINAPNGMNKQSWEVRVVDNPEFINGITDLYKKENPKAAERPGFKNMFNNAPTVVFIANDPSYELSQIDCGLLGENMILSAWSMGIGSCCLGGPVRFMKSPAAADYLKRLEFSEGYELLYAIAFGYPDETPAAKPRKTEKVRFIVSIRPTTGIKPLYTTIATVTMNLIVSAAIVLLNPYVTIYISYKIPPFALSVHIPDVSTSIYVEVDSKVLLGLPFCDKAFVR